LSIEKTLSSSAFLPITSGGSELILQALNRACVFVRFDFELPAEISEAIRSVSHLVLASFWANAFNLIFRTERSGPGLLLVPAPSGPFF
jgi:hypothetical protein